MSVIDQAATQAPFSITRRLQAPRTLVWKAFTDPAHLVHWWGPKGFTVTHCELDLTVGGTFHYALAAPDGTPMWGKWVFQEIQPPERLANLFQFSDPEGGVTRHPMAPDWPLRMRSVLTLLANGDATHLTIEVAAWQASDAEQRVFAANHGSLAQGYGGTLDQLTDYLESL